MKLTQMKITKLCSIWSCKPVWKKNNQIIGGFKIFPKNNPMSSRLFYPHHLLHVSQCLSPHHLLHEIHLLDACLFLLFIHWSSLSHFLFKSTFFRIIWLSNFFCTKIRAGSEYLWALFFLWSLSTHSPPRSRILLFWPLGNLKKMIRKRLVAT